jgi:hypothetical protein
MVLMEHGVYYSYLYLDRFAGFVSRFSLCLLCLLFPPLVLPCEQEGGG